MRVAIGCRNGVQPCPPALHGSPASESRDNLSRQMSDRYTDAVHLVLSLAEEEAGRLSLSATGTEHLLLGLLRYGRGLSQLLVRDGLSVESVRRVLVPGIRTRGDEAELLPPRNADARRALVAAGREADDLGDPHIGTHHLLLALLGDQAVGARRVLQAHAIDGDGLRRELRGMLSRPTRVGQKPRIKPSYDVHVSVSRPGAEPGRRSDRGPDHWISSGHDIKSMLAELCHVDHSRVDWQTRLGDLTPLEIEVNLPEYESHDEIDRLVREAILTRFGLELQRETRQTEVYILTVADGPAPQRKSVPGGGGVFAMSSAMLSVDDPMDPPPQDLVTMRALMARMTERAPSGFSGRCDVDMLCSFLGQGLGRPVENQTGLIGSFEWQVQREGEGLEGFFSAMRDQAGLIATPAVVQIEMLVVRDAED